MRYLLLPFICLLIGCSSEESKTTGADEKETKVVIEKTVDDSKDIATDVVDPEVTVEVQNAEEIAVNTDAMNGEATVEDHQYDDIDWEEYEESMKSDYSYVILISTKSYDAALERATEAAEKLGYKLDLRELSPHDEIGLTLPVEVCDQICGGDVGIEYPVYLPRDNFGDVKYVSVEYSDGYEGFTKGYYIVIAASGAKGSAEVTEALQEVKVHYADAYAKTCGVWMGCGC